MGIWSLLAVPGSSCFLIKNKITLSKCEKLRTNIVTKCRCTIKIQGIQKRMVRFQKLTRNLFLTLHGHNVRHQQWQLSKFLMRYQQFASHAYCGAAGPVSKMASQQEKAFCVLRFEASRSVITVQCSARFRKDDRAQNSRCTVITDLDTSKRGTQKVFSCCDAILETGPAVCMRSELLVAHEKLGQLPLLTVYIVPV